MPSVLPDLPALLSIIDAQSEIAARALDLPQACELLCRRARALTGAEAAVLRLAAPPVAASAGFVAEEEIGSRLSAPVADGPRAAGTLEVHARWAGAFDAVEQETLMLLAGVAGAQIGRARASERALRTALEDPLTALPNRRAFDQRVRQEIDRAVRYGRPLSLAVVVVEGLAEIGERHGEHAADDALLRVAHALLAIRSSDEAFRIAPGEFAVLVPETDAADVATFGARLRELIAAQRSGVPVVVSIGTAQARAVDPRRLEADARAALVPAGRVAQTLAA